jgi:hypothetical protein
MPPPRPREQRSGLVLCQWHHVDPTAHGERPHAISVEQVVPQVELVEVERDLELGEVWVLGRRVEKGDDEIGTVKRVRGISLAEI